MRVLLFTRARAMPWHAFRNVLATNLSESESKSQAR